MYNETKQRTKISILSRLVYNPKKQDNYSNKIPLYFDVIQHLRRAYKILKSLFQYITASIKLQLITKNTKWELKTIKKSII